MSTASHSPTALPPLQQMVKPALLTFSKGTRISDSGIQVNDTFQEVYIEPEKLQAYRSFFGFNEELPLPFLYLLAQRTQAALMLQKEYTLAIPGTIHLKNQLTQLKEVDAQTPFTLKGRGAVPYRETGSLYPVFEVEYWQNNVQVAFCKSEYLVKRKNKGPKTAREEVLPLVQQASFIEPWSFDKKLGKAYADVSDDHNPIHKSKSYPNASP